MELAHIPLKHINIKNTDFRYRTYLTDESLTRTMKKSGLCDPVCLLKQDNSFLIIDGFKRIHALCEHFPSSFPVPAVTLKEKELTWKIHLALVLKQDKEGMLPFIEKVSAYLMFKKNHIIRDDAEILQALNLPDRADYHKIYTRLADLPEVWSRFFTDHTVPGRRIKAMCEAVDLKACTSLLNVMPGLNRMEQSIIMLSEIEKREGVSAGKILQAVLDELHEDPIKPERVFLRIREIRYPLRSKYEKKVDDALKALHPPPFVSAQCDKKGERPGVEIVAHIQSPQDVEEFLSWFEKTKDSINKLLNERLEL
ncbi:TPA: hypothetical protein DCG86_02130 [Candidatus Marinimicrobia bacterium]|nr:MAG: hypothetical protein XD77_0566 [Marinimicrobia bacterium 46_47]KUK93462.1 MAG: hypothetical protein XE04_0222 [Marinimicrobia bacterium 46_43]HAE86802.1 hypothetical protein [Candidatus Neomarinimicrobiota bacterium]HBY18948.1 hypothetical protein [Candidatus Neomarinimicrobiota bacterium]